MTKNVPDWPNEAWLNKQHLTRLVANVVGAEVAASRKQDIQRLRPDLWNGDTGMIDTGLALDSLERMNCASALNQFFHLFDYGAEDYLLAGETLADWVYVVAVSIANGFGKVTFETSGSTGTPKPCTHDLAYLRQEVGFWAEHFKGRKQIAALVPPHHIYGFLFTTLLPQAMGIPVLDLRYSGAGALKEALDMPGTLVIGAPIHWQYVARSFLRLPIDVQGVTSTAPMPHQLKVQLAAQGLAVLTEIYGSSETAGVGYRTDSADAYTLLPYWAFEAGDEASTLVHQQSGERFALMDQVMTGPDRRFSLQGRKDGAVQVGGINVFPDHVADVLRSQPQVADCAARPDSATGRLSVFIVPHEPEVDLEALEDALRAVCASTLKAVERPSVYRFGFELPRTQMGKVASW